MNTSQFPDAGICKLPPLRAPAIRRVYAKKFDGRCASCGEMKNDLHYWAAREEMGSLTSYAICTNCAGIISPEVVKALTPLELAK